MGAAFVRPAGQGRAKPVEALARRGLPAAVAGPFRPLGAVISSPAVGAGGGATMVMHGPIAASTAGPSVICWRSGWLCSAGDHQGADAAAARADPGLHRSARLAIAKYGPGPFEWPRR